MNGKVRTATKWDLFKIFGLFFLIGISFIVISTFIFNSYGVNFTGIIFLIVGIFSISVPIYVFTKKFLFGIPCHFYIYKCNSGFGMQRGHKYGLPDDFNQLTEIDRKRMENGDITFSAKPSKPIKRTINKHNKIGIKNDKKNKLIKYVIMIIFISYPVINCFIFYIKSITELLSNGYTNESLPTLLLYCILPFFVIIAVIFIIRKCIKEFNLEPSSYERTFVDKKELRKNDNYSDELDSN
ncbi:MAG: hypothetical protein R3Y05_02400 [bacterium]